MDTNESANDGVLNSTFRAEESDADEGEPAGLDATAEPAAPEGQPQKVSLTRRERARERDERILGEVVKLRESSEQRDREYRENLEAIRRENAELRGYVAAGSRAPQQEQRRDETPDPEKLRRAARAALDARDFGEYERLNEEAIEARILRNPRFAQQQAPQAGPQTNPMLVATAAQYGDVMSNPLALQVATAYDSELQRTGIPNGPDRWKQAFEHGRAYMKANTRQAGQQFSQRNREVVSGVPSNGSGGARGNGGGEPGIILSAEERATAKRYKMSEQEYAKELSAMRPERIVK